MDDLKALQQAYELILEKSYKKKVSSLVDKLDAAKKPKDISKLRAKIEELRERRRKKELKQTS